MSLSDLDGFFDRLRLDTLPVSYPILTYSISLSNYIPDFYSTGNKNRQQEYLFKMTQVLSLEINTTLEELEEYCHCKNVDLAIL